MRGACCFEWVGWGLCPQAPDTPKGAVQRRTQVDGTPVAFGGVCWLRRPLGLSYCRLAVRGWLLRPGSLRLGRAIVLLCKGIRSPFAWGWARWVAGGC